MQTLFIDLDVLCLYLFSLLSLLKQALLVSTIFLAILAKLEDVFNLRVWAPISYLLFLQCPSKFVAHCLILLGGYYASINFLLITSFIPCLNSSTNSLSLYLLLLTALLNSYTNSSIVLLPYSTFFNSVTFIILLSSPSNSFFKSIKNFPIITHY